MEINYLAVVVSLLINILKRYVSPLANFFTSKLFPSLQASQQDLYAQLAELKSERDSYNPIDEFAKYALCDRKINKLVDKIKEGKSEVTTKRMKKFMIVSGVFYTLIAFASIWLIWHNYDRPVINFGINDEVSLFAPLTRFLSFPSVRYSNSIGVTVWLFILNRLIDISIAKYNLFKPQAKESLEWFLYRK